MLPTRPLPASPPRAAVRPRSRGQAGFTLIEVLVTALITGLLATATATALISQTHSSGDQRLRAQADTFVNQDQDRLRGLTDQLLSNLASSGPSSRSISVNGASFTVTSSAAYQDSSGTSSCASGSVDYFKVVSTVRWSESFNNSTPAASAESLISRPVTGQLQTSVSDQTGASLAGVAVTATPSSGPGGQTGQTDGAGCSLFAGLAAGPYTDRVAKSGYVDSSNSASPSQSPSVTASGTTASATFVLGLAGSLSATFKASTTAASPTYGGQADALSYSGSGAGGTASSPSTVLNGGTAASSLSTSTTLFPWNKSAPGATPSYSNNYAVWAGKCAFQQYPNGSTGTYDLGSVNPGASATATVQEPFLYIPTFQAMISGSTYSVQPSDVVLTYSSGGCTDSYQATVASPGNGVSGVGGTAPTTGWLASPGQPYGASGTLSVCADVLYQGTYYYGTVSTANTNMTAKNTVPAINVNTSTSGRCPVSS